MAIQTINQGTAPTGAGGDTFRSGSAKLQANDNEIYNYLGDGTNLNKLGTAAFKNTGTQAGNVMQVGSFGVGATTIYDLRAENLTNPNQVLGKGLRAGIIEGSKVGGISPYCSAILLSAWHDATAIGAQPFILFSDDGHLKSKCSFSDVSGWGGTVTYRSSRNTTVDANGFIKAASPIVQLFADKIEPNDEAQQQNIDFEKLGVGDYLIKNSTGFSNDGWYIEMPKDANGNVLVAVQYQQLKDNTIEVKVFAKKFDEETGDIVPNLEKPRDIPSGRWIDIRLKALPQPEIEISKTPADFQPTNLAQAVKEALKNDSEQ